MESILILVHIIAAIAIVALVLLQRGKGAEMGASFGSGASQTLFGSRGSGNVLTRSTTILAVVFFVTSLGLAIVARDAADRAVQGSSLIENTQILNEQRNPAPAANDADDDVPQVRNEEVPPAQSGGDVPVAP